MANKRGKCGNSDIFYVGGGGPKITAMASSMKGNLDSILKSKDITLLTKVCIVKAMIFPIVMYGCESWTVRKAEHQKIDPFELGC